MAARYRVVIILALVAGCGSADEQPPRVDGSRFEGTWTGAAKGPEGERADVVLQVGPELDATLGEEWFEGSSCTSLVRGEASAGNVAEFALEGLTGDAVCAVTGTVTARLGADGSSLTFEETGERKNGSAVRLRGRLSRR